MISGAAEKNRLNGFRYFLAQNTWLKPGVNDKKLELSMPDAIFCLSVRQTALPVVYGCHEELSVTTTFGPGEVRLDRRKAHAPGNHELP